MADTRITLKQIRARKERRRTELERNLRSLTRQLRRMGALKIVLFGSFAQGRVRSSSDLDVISIMPSTRSGRQWMKKIYGDVDREVDCDILAYTPEELERTVPVSRFLRHALRNGRVIYEKRSPGIGPMLRGLTRPLLADSHSCVCWGLPLR